MTRFDAVRILVRSIRKPLPGRGYTRRFPRLYRAFTATMDRVLPGSPCIVRVGGHRMYVDPRDHGVDRALIFGGDHEADEKHLILSLIQPGMVVFEIGANIGDYTLAFSRQCGPAGKVYAFEPSPKTFAVLRRNVELNGYRNTVLANRAVSDTEGLACLFEDADSSGNSSLFSSAVPAGGQGIEVESTTLDTFVHSNGIGRFHLLKADAQGSEYLILSGASDCLRRFRPMLCLEFWPLGIRQSGAQPAELLELLRSLDYSLFIIRDGVRSVQQLEASSDREILSECRVRGGERGFCDILAIPPAGNS
jgi:FkbM family methyltransferase